MLFTQSDNGSSSWYCTLSLSDDLLSVNARKTIQTWYKKYPVSDKTDFLGRFCSDDNKEHLGAFFELFIYSIFSKNQYQIERGGKKMPDFLVDIDGQPIHIECRISGNSQRQEGAYKGLIGFYKQINSIKSDYAMSFEVEEYNEEQLFPISKYKRFLEKYLASNQIQLNKDIAFERDGWKILAKPEKEKTGDMNNFIMLFSGIKAANAPKYLKMALQKKRPKKYEFDKQPYIIAINSMEFGLTNHEIKQALFGDYSWDPFFGKEKNTSISGVVIYNRLIPQWIESVQPLYFANPYAKHPVDYPDLITSFE